MAAPTPPPPAPEGPSALILGGCGFVGRHLVALLVKAGVPRIRVVDKLMPAMAFLSPELKEAFDKVEFNQAGRHREEGGRREGV
mmetsp:Transcript_46351/g.150547  ORF Transcript_46351/g.150547 Transcript_46351/m.150547 type:complete len:84 (+) Transcript_46351:166-417(+)